MKTSKNIRNNSYNVILENLDEMIQYYEKINIKKLIKECKKNILLLRQIENNISNTYTTEYTDVLYILYKFSPEDYKKQYNNANLEYLHFNEVKMYLLGLYNESTEILDSLYAYDKIK